MCSQKCCQLTFQLYPCIPCPDVCLVIGQGAQVLCMCSVCSGLQAPSAFILLSCLCVCLGLWAYCLCQSEGP